MGSRKWLLGFCVIGLALWWWGSPISMSSAVLQPPSAEHWLGTDDLGRDWLQRLVQAFPATLLIAFLCGLLPLCMGLLLASVSTIGGVWLDRALLKMTDIFLIIPSLLPLMILSAILEPGLPAVVVLISAVSWPDDFRVLRAAIRRQQLGDAIFSARSFGAGRGYLLRHHVWPALVPLMEVLFIQNARRAVMLSAGLAFLGLTDPRMSNWGTMLFEAQEHMHLDAFWWMLPGPLFAMTVLILLLNSTHAGPEKSAL